VSSNPTTSTGRSGARIQLGSRRGRAALAGAALLVALPVLAGCAAGNNPEVYQIQPDNGGGKVGYTWISNVWVVADTTTGNAEVIGQVANTDPTATNSVELTSVTVAGATATIVPPTDSTRLDPGVQVAAGSVTIPGLGAVQFGQHGQPELELSNADLTVGSNTQVVYTFSNGQTVTVSAIVQPPTGLWAGYNPNGANGTPTATASGIAAVTGTATATASGTSTATATGTSTATATGTAKASGTATATASATATAGATR
jgi:hypothetical protein